MSNLQRPTSRNPLSFLVITLLFSILLLHTAYAFRQSSCKQFRLPLKKCEGDNQDENVPLEELYLERIGISKQQTIEIIQRKPNLDDLQNLLTAQLLTVPFENMDLLTHPSDGETTIIPRREEEFLPSLDVIRSLNKIIRMQRGGFCFELNFSFAWLLRTLGYKVRLALADVGCQQATSPGKVPAHVVIMVDDLIEYNGDSQKKASILVDPGFGSPGVCEKLLPLVYNQPVESHGDVFHFAVDDSHPRFDTVLFRKRITSQHIEEPMYRFYAADDLNFDSEEFCRGLSYVLKESPTFNGKRICVLSTDRGHMTLGSNYLKWVERGNVVQRVDLPTEKEYRRALLNHFGVVLRP